MQFINSRKNTRAFQKALKNCWNEKRNSSKAGRALLESTVEN